MTDGWRRFWGQPAPTPSPEPVRAAERPPARSRGSVGLAGQVTQALVDEKEGRRMTLVEFAALLDMSLSTVRGHRYGQGMRVETLDKIAQRLGWTIVITDSDQREIGRV